MTVEDSEECQFFIGEGRQRDMRVLHIDSPAYDRWGELPHMWDTEYLIFSKVSLWVCFVSYGSDLKEPIYAIC